MPEAFQYFELRTAIGGAALGIMQPIGSRRRLSVNGDDALSFNIQADHRLVPQIEKGKIVREVLSVDGATWREWEIKDYRLGAVLMFIECRPIMEMLKAYPVHLVDGDGYVYTDAPAIQLPPATMISSRILSTTPAVFALGTVTPTALGEVPFSGDNARSGLLRMEEIFPPYNAQLRWSGTQYLVDFIQIGVGAPILYLRDMKNIVAIEKRTTADHINRLTQIRGADGDDGPTGIAWAYWEVTAKSGADPNVLLTLAAIHGGDGPIKFDGQFNHANLPGGVSSLYLESITHTYVQITDSIASTQQLKVAAGAAFAVGNRVRVCASSTGKHLTFLDAPAEIALYGVQPGAFESGYDDTHTVNKNAMQAAWATPASLPDGWTGLGAQTTVSADVISSGKALLINQSVADGAQIAAPPAAVVKIRARQTKWCATAWIKVKAAFGAGGITFQLKANGTVVGAGLLYGAPSSYTVGVYRQLIVRGLDLSTFVGTSPSLVAEIIKSGGTGTVHMVVDDICITPTIGERAACDGSNDARTWQEANRFLDAARASYYQWPVTDADLARNGITAEAGASLGGTVVMETEKYGTVSARILQINDVPEDPSQGASYEISTLPPRFSRAKVKPAEFLIPFGVPQEVTTAQVGEANAVLIVKVITPFTQTATQITINLTVMDTRGGAPTVVGVAVGGATIASGSGSGPWVINRPAAGAGVGRATFTASLPGRADVWDAIDVPEQVAAALVYTECQAKITAVTATTVTVTVTSVSPSGTPTVQLVAITGSATLNSGLAIGTTGASPQVWVFNRGAFQAGVGQAQFRAVLAGQQSDDDFVDIAEVGRDTVSLLSRARVLATSATSVTVRVAVADPYPQGTNSATVNYQKFPAGLVIDVASGVGVTPAATLTEAAGTTIDYVVTRPAAGSGTARVTFTVVAANRMDDSDAVDVPEQAADTPNWSIQQTTETDTSVTVTVAITYDPESRVTGVEFATQTGQGAVSGFVLDSVAPFTQSVTLIEGQASKVFYRIKGTFQDGTSGTLAEDFMTVKSSAMPTPPIMTLRMDTTGAVTARIEGDDLTLSLRVASSLSAMPADATVDAATAVNGRQLTTATLQTVTTPNPTCYVKAVAYSAASGGGIKSIYVQATLTYTKSVTKTIRIPGTAFQSQDTTGVGNYFVGYIRPIVENVSYGFVAALVLPVGVTITNAAWRWERTDAGDVVDLLLYRTADITLTLIASQAPVSGTGINTTTLSLSQLVGTETYVTRVVLKDATGGSTPGVGLFWFEITYTTPSYEVTY